MEAFHLRDLQEAYNNVYNVEESLFVDIVNFCDSNNIFESVEESEYFADLIIENDLALTFVEDVLEYYDEEQLLEESYITEVKLSLVKAGLKAAGGLLKKATPAVRGLPAKTLVKQGYTPGGFSSTGKQLSKVNKPAFETQTRAIRQARAERKPPAPERANKYADMLAQKKASQAASSPKPSTSKTGGMTPSYVAKRGVTDTLATTLALGMGHMAGLKPATNVLKQFSQPIVRTVSNVGQKSAPIVSKTVSKTAGRMPKGSAADPWKQFPKKPQAQRGLPKEGPSSKLPNRVLPGSPTPKALPSAGKTSAKPTFKPEALPKSSPTPAQPGGKLVPAAKPELNKGATAPKPQQLPGQAQRDIALPSGSSSTSSTKKNKKSSEPSTGKGGTGSGLTHTVRATLSPAERGGNMRYPGMERYATTGKEPPIKKPKGSKIGPIAAGAGLVGAGIAGSQEPKDEKPKNIKTNVYNTMDPSGRIRSRAKVGPAKIGSTFEDAFRFYRKRGDKTFKYAGKEYTTKMAENLITDYLLSEGFASDKKSAEAIIDAMSDNWINNIFEVNLDKLD